MSNQNQTRGRRSIGRLTRRTAAGARHCFRESHRLYRVSIAAILLMVGIAVAAALLTRRGYAWTARSLTIVIVLEVVLYIVCVAFVIRGWFLMETDEHIREFFSPDAAQFHAESGDAPAFQPLTIPESTGTWEGTVFFLLSFAVWMAGVWFLFLRHWIADGSIGDRNLSLFVVHLLGAFFSIRAVRVVRLLWDRALWFRSYGRQSGGQK